MSAITTINASDLITNSRAVINTNFSNLNTDKIETSYLDTDTTLAADSDVKIASQKAVKAYVDATGGQTYLVPTGGILPYGGSSAPSNFLLCNGAAVSRSTYATLLGVIGTTFGTGDGSTTFNVPDLRARAPIGVGAVTKVATFVSRASNVITVSGLSDKANNEFQTGQAVLYATTGDVITGLSDDTTYYLIRTGNLTFSLATSLVNAQNGTVISLSGDGTGTQTFTLTLTTRVLGETGGEENHAMSSTELLAHTHATASFRTSVDQNESSGASTDGGSSSGTGSAGGNAAMNNMQPFLGINYIIKT